MQWINQPLSQQAADLQVFLHDGGNADGSNLTPIDIAKDAYTALPPDTALSAERELFAMDLKILLATMDLTRPEGHSDSATDPRVRSAVILVERAELGTTTIKSISQQLGLSADHFRKLFKEWTGNTFSRFLRGVRMKEAARLLRATRLSVDRVAAQTGYSAPTNFGNAFKSIFGLTPRQYRMRRRPPCPNTYFTIDNQNS